MNKSRGLGNLGEWASLDEVEYVNVCGGAVRLSADSIGFYGYAGDLYVRMGVQRSFDLSTNRHADVTLALPATVDEYRISLFADVVLVTHVCDGSSLRLHPRCGVRELSFLDGSMCLTGALCRSLRAHSLKRSIDHHHPITFAKIMANRDDASAVVVQKNTSKGFLMEIGCATSIDALYQSSAADPVRIPGRMCDVVNVSGEVASRVICLTRGVHKRPERIHVFGEGYVEFSDHRASAASICASLQAHAEDSSPTACLDAPRVQAAAIYLGPCLGEDELPELGQHLAVSDLMAGQVVDMEVTLDKPRLVLGIPQIELRIDGLTRLGRYVSGNGGSTLRFVYQVLPADIQQLSTLSNGSAGDQGNRDEWSGSVEVGRLVLHNAVLLNVDALACTPGSQDAEISAAEAARLPLWDGFSLQFAQVSSLDVDLAVLEVASGVVSVGVDVQDDTEYQ